MDGIEGKRRLTGRSLAFGDGVSIEVVLRPGDGNLTTVSGDARLKDDKGGYAMPLTVATTDASGAAVVTGRYPTDKRVDLDGVNARYIGAEGAPIAAGFLPPGASNISVWVTTGEMVSGQSVSERLPDGRVIFTIVADFSGSRGVNASQSRRDPSKDSIKAVTWTNADGSEGRKNVTQQR